MLLRGVPPACFWKPSLCLLWLETTNRAQLKSMGLWFNILPSSCATHTSFWSPCCIAMLAGKPFVCCPRSALKHALAALKLAHGVRLLVGFELEFMLLNPAAAAAAGDATAGSDLVLQGGGGCFRPIDESIYCQSSAFDQAAPGE
jgi:glutamine synthetase